MAVLTSEASPTAPALHDGTRPGAALWGDPDDSGHLSWVHTLYALGQPFTVGPGQFNVHQQMLDHIVAGFGAHSGSIALRVDPDEDILELVAGTDLPPGLLGSRLPPAVGVYGHVLATGESLLINGDVAEIKLPVSTSERSDRSRHSTMCWPLRVNDQIIGAVAINRMPGQERYTVADLDRGQVVTNLLALVVANHRMHLERESRIVELSTLNELMRRMNQQLEEAQDQLMQSEKLASIGQIAAGVAHEINNPIGFVLSNLTTLESYLPGIFGLVDAYENVDIAPDFDSAKAAAHALRARMQFDYVRGDTTALLKESLEGILRVKHIVQDLKDFSRGAVNELWDTIDLHEALDRMLNIAKSEIKYKVSIETAYGDLPLVECQPSRLHQVFLNLLVNAAQAIEVSGTVRISTGRTASEVWICFEDSGCGIPHDQLSRIFDPFFTTKQVGKGTGLGLSVSYAIVNRHDGRIEVESEVGRGTRFKVWIPITRPNEYPSRSLSAAGDEPQLVDIADALTSA